MRYEYNIYYFQPGWVIDKTPYKSIKRKNNLDKTIEGLPTPLKKVCQQMGTAEQVNTTFDDLAGCNSVLLVHKILIKILIKLLY